MIGTPRAGESRYLESEDASCRGPASSPIALQS